MVRLLGEARQHGLSLSAYLAEFARQSRRSAMLAAAREESGEFETNPSARAEFELWEGTLADGVD